MSFNRGVENENVAHIHSGILSSYKEKWYLEIEYEWKDLEKVTLSELT